MLLWWFVGVFFFTPGSGFFSLPSSLTRLPCCRLHQALSWLSSALCKLFPKSAPPWLLSLRASPSADAAGWHPQDTLQTAGPQGSRRTSTRLMLCQRTTLCNPCKASSSCSLRWAPWGRGCHRHHTSRAAGTRTRRHRADKLFNVILIENTSHLLPHSPPRPKSLPVSLMGDGKAAGTLEGRSTGRRSGWVIPRSCGQETRQPSQHAESCSQKALQCCQRLTRANARSLLCAATSNITSSITSCVACRLGGGRPAAHHGSCGDQDTFGVPTSSPSHG